jgi:hypothetical protein
VNLDLIDAVGEALGIEVALAVGSEDVAILVALADKLDGSFKGKTVGAGDLEAELSRVALRVHRKSEERKSENEDAGVE